MRRRDELRTIACMSHAQHGDGGASFLDLGRRKNLDADIANTIVRLMDCVSFEMAEDKRSFFRRLFAERNVEPPAGAAPRVDRKKLDAAWRCLERREWISLQGDSRKRPVVSLEPLRGLRRLRRLCLWDNAVGDLEPLSGLSSLVELRAKKNQIRTLAPLRGCTSLHTLDCPGNPITDFSALAALPALRDLKISAEQVPVFCSCGALTQLRKLEIVAPGVVPSLRDLPPMPKLIRLDVDGLESLEGLERCRGLLNLSVRGTFGSLVPCAGLARLTVGYFTTDRDLDMSPLSALYALRKLGFSKAGLKKLEALNRLPVLREVGAWSGAEQSPGLAPLQLGLASWDEEFLAKGAGRRPAQVLQVVTREEFDRFDSSEPYGLRADECDEEMVLAEQEWLQNRIRASLSIDLTDEEDFCLPIERIGFRRSHTLMLYSLKAYTCFREIVHRVQTALGEARNDWIIYCQSELSEGTEEPPAWAKDFVVWIYPSEIWVTKEHEAIVRRLLSVSDDLTE